ncbi:hypothetical protein [Ensifer sp. SSB1]|nr:hypothetical protein [Ensifer sp. SSB1]MBK5569595.1 hypothetical protein [Ensifer sp. SSB1]
MALAVRGEKPRTFRAFPRQVVGLEALSRDKDADLERLLGDLVARLVDE